MKTLKLVVLSLLLLQIVGFTMAVAAEVTLDSALKNMKDITRKLQTEEGVESLFNPLMQKGEKFKTLDGSKEFFASLLCREETTILRVTASPSAGSELTITIAYDMDLDGTLESTLVIPRMGGACVNGAVFNCSPADSWSGCEYGLLEFQGNTLTISSKMPGGTPRAPHGLLGCFCFNGACGSTAQQNMERILSTMALGTIEKLKESIPDLYIGKKQFNPLTSTLEYLGSKGTNCTSEAGELIADRSSLFGELTFPVSDALAQEKEKEDSPWNLVFGRAISSKNQYTCERRARVSFGHERIISSVITRFGIGYDSNGGSKQCYYFTSSGSCGRSFSEPRNWETCLAQVSGSHLGTVCSELYLPSGYFDTITNVTNAYATSGRGNFISCYGSDDDSYDQWWTMDCHGTRIMEVPYCESPSMGEKGKVLYNNPYDKNKYQGCYKVTALEDACDSLAKRQDCRVKTLMQDGVYIIKDGYGTNIKTSSACRVFSSNTTSVTVCEPWWFQQITYECDNPDDQFDKAKQRAKAVTDGIEMDSDKRWLGQGDLAFGEDGAPFTRHFDTDILFAKTTNICKPACLVEWVMPKDEMVLPGQGKLESDGNYHVEYPEPTYMPQGNRAIQRLVSCEVENDKYVCPTEPGQTIKYDCTCSNKEEFSKAIAGFVALAQISTDFICSTGQEYGVCSSEDLGVNSYRVVCYADGALSDCAPNLWIGKTVQPQTHKLVVSENYDCQVDSVNGVKQDYSPGPVNPQTDWFAPAVSWAKDLIIKTFTDEDEWKADQSCDCGASGNEIPVCQKRSDSSEYVCLTSNIAYASAQACASHCAGRATQGKDGICLWTDNLTSTGDIPITYNIGLNPGNDAVFGEVFLNAAFTGTITEVDKLPECVEESYVEPTESYNEPTACVQSQAQDSVDLWFGIGWDKDGSSTDCYSFTTSGQCEQHFGKPSNYDSCISSVTSAKVGPLCNSYVSNGYFSRLISSTAVAMSGRSNIVDCWGSGNDAYDTWYAARCVGMRTSWKCPTSGKESFNGQECANSCTLPRYRCSNTGRIVDDPAQCVSTRWGCEGRSGKYYSLAACKDACKFSGVTNPNICQVSKTTKAFAVYIKEKIGTPGLNMRLEEVGNRGERIYIQEEEYPTPEKILKQCFTDYTAPYIKFDEPGTNAHFEVSHIDHVIYSYAASQKELPSIGNGAELPKTPPVYVGGKARKLDEALLQQEDSRDEETGKLPPLKASDKELLDDPAARIPKIPMFWGKATSNTWAPSASHYGQLTLTASNLTSNVYYFECPRGKKQPGQVNCGAQPPYGGIAETISGTYCFQYFCDAEAITDDIPGSMSGCGMAADGRFK